ncbi:hypothetical protein [Polynucleobacter sp. AP-Melu-500A-A1]|uniref:hypothetical protein n=1 Tax=Polynucleobacter sp. AP-Melu-500A-A1 TaxID=2576929 RepID=UPI001C0B690E|nr:hypothetical protein [Polynucleobacter sp. AP-Melu-500A-A1]
MTKKILLISIMMFSSLAYAQSVPNLIGTWDAVSAVSASSGTEEKQARLVLSNKKDSAILKLVISTQEGAAFQGETSWRDGLKNIVVGVFHKDGKTLTFSSDVGVGTGYVVNDEMEFCSASVLTTKNRASCTQLKKVK